MKLSAKVACVTGSARGIGWEIVQSYAREGAQVVICDLHQADVNAALARLGLPVESALGVEADITAEEDASSLFRAIRERFRPAGYPGEQRRLCLAPRGSNRSGSDGYTIPSLAQGAQHESHRNLFVQPRGIEIDAAAKVWDDHQHILPAGKTGKSIARTLLSRKVRGGGVNAGHGVGE
jgi:NAD(P)-dependent dehydrogenase (short-subunit alcohol dehydrogenase family)